MNSTEWELTLELNEFYESWMRYAKGFGCNRTIFLDFLPDFDARKPYKATLIAISINHPTEEGFKRTFQDDWRAGKEIQKIMISRRLYQVSPNETKS